MSIQSQIVKPESTPTAAQLKVYVANLGKYTEGELVGGWISLPAAQAEIKAFLRDEVGLNARYEEHMIQDYESDFKIGEYESVYELNMLAVKLEALTETEQALAAAYCHANSIQTALGMLNICEQLDELSYTQIDQTT